MKKTTLEDVKTSISSLLEESATDMINELSKDNEFLQDIREVMERVLDSDHEDVHEDAIERISSKISNTMPLLKRIVLFCSETDDANTFLDVIRVLENKYEYLFDLDEDLSLDELERIEKDVDGYLTECNDILADMMTEEEKPEDE